MKKLAKAIISCVLCLAVLSSMGLSASADSASTQKVNLLGGSDSGGGSIPTGNSLKERLAECITVYNSYQNVKSTRTAKKPDAFTTVYTVDGVIKQIDVFADCIVKEKSSSSNYLVFDDFSVIYYYTDDGLPRFALIMDKSSVYNKEYRFYLSEGEVIKWVDNEGNEYFEEPTNFPGLYEIALANYARAMYDCYDKGKYVVQMGCFTDKDDAEKCMESMTSLGEDVVIDRLDDAYCVVSHYYFKDWDSATEYGKGMEFSDDCGIIFVRLL